MARNINYEQSWGSAFHMQQARNLLRNKYILLIGDSVQRAVYKDLVALVNNQEMLTTEELKKSQENSFRGDKCLATSEKNAGIRGYEIREYVGFPNAPNSIVIRYAYVTKIFDCTKTQHLLDIMTREQFPDVLMVNSLFWDISKYNSRPVIQDHVLRYPDFEENLKRFIIAFEALELKRALDKNQQPCLKIWRSSMPISKTASAGFIDQTTDKIQLVEDISHTNLAAERIMNEFKWDVVDCQYWFEPSALHHRTDDGVHWNAKAHRWLSNIFLSHISIAWGIGLPMYVPDQVLGMSSNLKIKVYDAHKGQEVQKELDLPRSEVKFGKQMHDEDTKNMKNYLPDQ